MNRSREANSATGSPNHSVERIGASRSARFQFVRQWRLPPAAHPDCYE